MGGACVPPTPQADGKTGWVLGHLARTVHGMSAELGVTKFWNHRCSCDAEEISYLVVSPWIGGSPSHSRGCSMDGT